MKTVFSYIKKELPAVIVCILLLFVQAYTDLALPEYMADIVNVGIQQSGIEEGAPRVISADGMHLMTRFLDEADKAQLLSMYSERSDESIESFPKASSMTVYEINDGADTDRAGELFSSAAYALVSLVQKSGGAENASAEMSTSEIYALNDYLDTIPSGILSESITNGQQADMSLKSQYASGFIKMFYSELECDLSQLQRDYIIRVGMTMLGVTVLSVLAAVTVGFFSSRLGASLARRIRRDVFARVESFNLTELDRFSTASLITRTTNDVTQVQMLVTMGLRMVCYAPIMAIGGITRAVSSCISLTWIIALAVVVLLGLVIVIFTIALPKFKSVQRLVDKLNLVTRENLSGMMVIRAFGNQQAEEERFRLSNNELTQTNLFVNRVMAFMFPCMNLVMNLTSVAILWFGGRQIEAAAIQVGDMMAFMQYGMQIIGAFLMIAMMFIILPRAAVSAGRIAEVLNTEPVVKEPEKPFRFETTPHGVITFDKVSFRYPGAEEDVLHSVSFTANSNETTAFIGSTGSGKSTIVNLIPRFYDVTRGEILLDGVNIKDISTKELRGYISIVPQKAVLFSGNIEGNISYGSDITDGDNIRKAAETAQAHEFISETQDGYEGEVAQGGSNYSGGQKQRLSIARAIAKKAPVYIFDDSFSALDFKTDAALRKALHGHIHNAAVLIVAQRVSTVMNADKIIVLSDGKIVGQGKHNELIGSCEVYREICRSQLSAEEMEGSI